MASAPYGNDPSKIQRYLDFWKRAPVKRPLAGFSLVGWFPMGEFAACKQWEGRDCLTPEMVDPEAFLDDHVRMAREGEQMDDDLIRGACPGQVTVPWLPAMIGCRLRILPENVLGDERRLSWPDALAVRQDSSNVWFRKYEAFLAALVRRAGGAFPVSHTAELGPCDLHAVLRGHNESILDLADEPEKSAELLMHMGELLADFTTATWERVPRFCNGWFDAQYSLWAPAPIVRMQEDASAVYSPRLYRQLLQPVDRIMASRFAGNFMHLHSTSMFLLEAILEVEEIRCFEINNDAVGPPVARMVPYFRKVQDAGRPLLIRGSLTPDELRLLVDSLDPRGLMFNIMVSGMEEVEPLRRLIGM
jgi:hypothetical protein